VPREVILPQIADALSPTDGGQVTHHEVCLFGEEGGQGGVIVSVPNAPIGFDTRTDSGG
jgi:hypothetical protein